jgi:hypothetical protein
MTVHVTPQPPCLDVRGVEIKVGSLIAYGSRAAPGYDKPEGIVVYHTASRSMYKVTLEGDEKPKGSTE